MQRYDILNTLTKKFEYENYLEIGIQCQNNFKSVKVKNKTGIEPFPPKGYENGIDYQMTSDEFFNQLDDDVKYDLVFIDGLHHREQVLRDIENSLKHLTENGSILCHDCLPNSEKEQMREDQGGVWMGDVWKTMFDLMKTRDDLEIQIIDTDCGCGLIRKGKQETVDFDNSNMDYNFFVENKNKVLNIISPTEFLELING